MNVIAAKHLKRYDTILKELSENTGIFICFLCLKFIQLHYDNSFVTKLDDLYEMINLST